MEWSQQERIFTINTTSVQGSNFCTALGPAKSPKFGGHFALFKHGHLLGRDVYKCINPDSPDQGIEIAEVKSPACFSISGDEFAAGITSLLPGVNNLRLWNGLEYDRAYLLYYVWLPKKWFRLIMNIGPVSRYMGTRSSAGLGAN